MKAQYHLTFPLIILLAVACQNKSINLSTGSMEKELQNIESAKMEKANKEEVVDSVWTHAPYTASLENAIEYLRENNKYKDWDPADKKRATLLGIVEKDSTITDLKLVKSSGVKELDDEALRLIRGVKVSPGQDGNGNIVRSEWTMIVPFPAQ